MVAKRFDVWLINLDPTIGSEIKKTRPCLIMSPDEANQFLSTVIIIPLTSTIKKYPTRINCIFQRKKGQLATDQIRSLDKIRLIKKSGRLNDAICRNVCDLLQETFSYE
ncbi:MAG: type II toxin-antitoxin system PemK/MazF family toxin [Parafilimonas sp.]